jgi:hypothetical protein
MLLCIFTSFKHVQPHLNMSILSYDRRKIRPELSLQIRKRGNRILTFLLQLRSLQLKHRITSPLHAYLNRNEKSSDGPSAQT